MEQINALIILKAVHYLDIFVPYNRILASVPSYRGQASDQTVLRYAR